MPHLAILEKCSRIMDPHPDAGAGMRVSRKCPNFSKFLSGSRIEDPGSGSIQNLALFLGPRCKLYYRHYLVNLSTTLEIFSAQIDALRGSRC